LVVALPPKKVAVPPMPASVLQVSRSSEADEGEEASATPAALALVELMRSILSATDPVSLLEWQRHSESASQLSPGVWVFFATTALEAGPHWVDGKDVEFALEMLVNPPGQGRKFSRTFRDACVTALKVLPARGVRRESARG
jgi:hypothetical protein